MIEKETALALVRSNFSLFVRGAFSILYPAEKYVPARYVDLLAYQLEQLPASKTHRLVVNVPPRHLKSTIISVAFPAWLLGHSPNRQILCVSYGLELTTHLSKQTRQLMESDWYNSVFPDAAAQLAEISQDQISTTVGGYRKAVSMGGGLTGFGGDYVLIDDPQKAHDVNSDIKRQQAINLLQNTILTRLNNPQTGCIVLVQQRLHQQDLSGAMLDTGKWDHVNLPAIAEVDESIPFGNRTFVRKAGEVLVPERISKAVLDDRRAEIGDAEFSAQYQQRPLPGGGILQLSAFRRYSQPPTKGPEDFVIHSWDVAYTVEKHSDCSVCTVWVLKDYCLYLTNVIRRKVGYVELRQLVSAYGQMADRVVIEGSSMGLALYQELRSTAPGKYWPDTPRESKEARLLQVRHYIETGRVWLPSQAPWLPEFVSELLAFPSSKHDDQVDSFVQGLRWLHFRTARPPTNWTPPKPDKGIQQLQYAPG